MKTVSKPNPRAKKSTRSPSEAPANRPNSRDDYTETVLKRRIGDVVPISALVPFVLAATLAEGQRQREADE